MVSALLRSTSAGRTVAARSKLLILEAMSSAKPALSFSSAHSRRSAPCISRICGAIGSMESLMPLHSAIASARLKSIIGVNSACWSSLSQGFAYPL